MCVACPSRASAGHVSKSETARMAMGNSMAAARRSPTGDSIANPAGNLRLTSARSSFAGDGIPRAGHSTSKLTSVDLPSLIADSTSLVAKIRPVLVFSHGRSGSTLLLEILQQDPQAWVSYEPLQEVRQMPSNGALTETQAGRCREGAQERSTVASRCPLRDATLLLALLSCDMLPLLSLWYQELALAGGKGGYLPNAGAFGSAWLPSSEIPDLSERRASMFMEQQQRCKEKSVRVAKTIRMNGHLDAVVNVSATTGLAPPLVLHLVRDLKSVYASRKGLTAPFGLPSTSSQQQRAYAVQSWARAMCTATRRDVMAGRRKHHQHYELLNFTELVRRPNVVIEKIYSRHFKRPVPATVRAYIEEHLPGRSNNSTNSSEEATWQFQFGTTARNLDAVEHAWERRLEPWEVRAIETGCGREVRVHAPQ